MAATLNEADSEFTTAECRFCGDTTTVYRDSSLCEHCDDDSIYCSICNDRKPGEHHCRHLFWDGETGWWSGPGSDQPEFFRAWLKGAMFRVAGSIGWHQTQMLEKVLRDHSYHFFYTASLLGGPIHLSLSFRSIEFDDAISLQSALQRACCDAERAWDEEMGSCIYSLWCLWSGNRNGDPLDLVTTPHWDDEYANALIGAFDCYGSVNNGNR